MAIIRYKHRTDVTKEGRKKTAGTTGGGGGGGGAPPTSAAFEKLAKERGVDLPAEQARARSQLEAGARVGGTTASTRALQAGITPTANKETIPNPTTPYATKQSPNPDGSFQYETPDGVMHHVSATGVDTILEAGTIVNISGADLAAFVVGGGVLLKGGFTLIASIKAAAEAAALKVGIGSQALYATNTATAKLTSSWLTKKIGLSVVGASGLMAAISTYPFAGFIKEEALQTIGFAVNAAINNDDAEGAEIALAHQQEILNPDVWRRIFGAIPSANILAELKPFYEASRIKLAIDSQRVEDMKIKIETGETEDERWERIRQKEADQDRAVIDYYNSERKKMLEWEQEAYDAARKAQRKEDKKARNNDAAFWAAERARQRELEAKDRQAIAEFWIAYRKQSQKLADDSRPSNLNFGLLG